MRACDFARPMACRCGAAPRRIERGAGASIPTPRWGSGRRSSPDRGQARCFLLGVEARAGEKAHPERTLEGEHATAPAHHDDDQMLVLPVLELGGADVKRLPADLAEVNVLLADQELAALKTHRGAAIAAAARLVEEEGAMSRRELANELERARRGAHPGGRLHGFRRTRAPSASS